MNLDEIKVSFTIKQAISLQNSLMFIRGINGNVLPNSLDDFEKDLILRIERFFDSSEFVNRKQNRREVLERLNERIKTTPIQLPQHMQHLDMDLAKRIMYMVSEQITKMIDE